MGVSRSLGWFAVSWCGVVSLREGSRLTRSCVGTAAVSVEMEGELGRGDAGLLDAGTDEGAGSERRRVEASAKSKSELSNSSRASAKTFEIVELPAKLSGKVSKGTKAS